jgi:hypothetical protein
LTGVFPQVKTWALLGAIARSLLAHDWPLPEEIIFSAIPAAEKCKCSNFIAALYSLCRQKMEEN